MADFAYVREALRLRVVEYLQKPVRYQELVTCFRRLYAQWDEPFGEDAPPMEPFAGYHQEIVRSVRQYIGTHWNTASLEVTAAVRAPFATGKYSTFFSFCS